MKQLTLEKMLACRADSKLQKIPEYLKNDASADRICEEGGYCSFSSGVGCKECKVRKECQ